MEYCATRYGPLSFGAGETLKLIQSRVAGGGYAAGGASLLDEADFTAANLSNAEKGGGAGEVMIHELVHQWWGLGNMFDTADPNSPWSAEGLTCYTTYRIAKQLYGEDYAQTHYVEHGNRRWTTTTSTSTSATRSIWSACPKRSACRSPTAFPRCVSTAKCP